MPSLTTPARLHQPLPPATIALITAALAAVYLLAARVAVWLAVPPGYVSTGFLLTSVVAGALLILSGEASRVSRLVDDRTAELRRANRDVQINLQRLTRANSELERFNRLAVGRELQMVRLKREINNLCQRLCEPPRYVVASKDEYDGGSDAEPDAAETPPEAAASCGADRPDGGQPPSSHSPRQTTSDS